MSENTTTATETSASKTKKEKAASKPKVEKVVETKEQLLKRLKKESPDKYARVTEILETGKGGTPTKVRIKTDDKDSSGHVQYRDIKPQDLFQVKLSVEGQKAEAKKKRNDAAKKRRVNKPATAAATKA